MKVKIFTNEQDYENGGYRTFEAEIHQSIDDCLMRTIVCDTGEVVPDKYMKIGNVVIPSYQVLAIKLEG